MCEIFVGVVFKIYDQTHYVTFILELIGVWSDSVFFFLKVIVGVPESEGMDSDKQIAVLCGVVKDTSIRFDASNEDKSCSFCSEPSCKSPGGSCSEFFTINMKTHLQQHKHTKNIHTDYDIRQHCCSLNA